jgi:hypothetical protein
MFTPRHHSAVSASSSHQCHSLNANANVNGNYHVTLAEQHQKQQKLSEHFKDSGRHFTAGGLAGIPKFNLFQKA